MKIKRSIIILLIVIALLMPSAYANNETIYIETNKSNTFDKILDAVNVLTVTMNFAFVIWMYFRDKKEKIVYDKNSYKMYWYKTFILENYLGKIESFFNECEEEIKKIQSSMSNTQTLDQIKEYKKNQFMKFTKEQSIIKQEITSIVTILSEDMSENIRNIFIGLQEEFTNSLDKLIMSDSSNYMQNLQECINMLSDKKREILNQLYTYGENIIK